MNINTALSTIREEINYISESMTIQRDKTLVPYKLTISKRNAIIELVKTYTFKNIKDFDHRDNRINFKNGHLIRTKQKKVFIEHFKHNENPYLSRIQIPVKYDPEATNLEMDQILADIFGFDTVPLIYEMLGYFLLPHTKYGKAFMLYGGTGTGKTTAINIMTQFIGYDNISGVELQKLDDNFEITKTKDKLINIFDDLSSRPIEYVGNFKKLVTNTWMYGRRKFVQEETKWKNRCKPLFASNVLPLPSKYITDAFYKRWILIPCFNNMKELDIKNNEIRGRIFSEKEMSGLLNKVLQALDRLEERRGFPEEWQDLEFVKNRWLIDMNPVSLFIEECCNKNDFGEINYEDFYRQVNKFRNSKRAKTITKTMMTKSLKLLGINKMDRGSKVEKQNRYYFKGLQFKIDYELEHMEDNKISIENYIAGE